jgi:hypothetical protein
VDFYLAGGNSFFIDILYINSVPNSFKFYVRPPIYSPGRVFRFNWMSKGFRNFLISQDIFTKKHGDFLFLSLFCSALKKNIFMAKILIVVS